MTPKTPTTNHASEKEPTLEELEEQRPRLVEALESLHRTAAHYAAEVERLDATIAERTTALAEVEDPNGRHAVKQRLIGDELNRDLAADALAKLQPQIEEAQAAVAANAAARLCREDMHQNAEDRNR